MSDSQRTDALYATRETAIGTVGLGLSNELIEHARQLERELNEARAQLARITGMKFSERVHAALVYRAETAEAQLAETERLRVFASEALLDQHGIAADLREQLAAKDKLIKQLTVDRNEYQLQLAREQAQLAAKDADCKELAALGLQQIQASDASLKIRDKEKVAAFRRAEKAEAQLAAKEEEIEEWRSKLAENIGKTMLAYAQKHALRDQLKTIRDMVEPLIEMERRATKGKWGIERTPYTNWIGPLRADGKVERVVVHTDRHCLNDEALARNDADADLIAALHGLLPKLAEACK